MASNWSSRVSSAETMTRDAVAVTADLKEIAARYREEADALSRQLIGRPGSLWSVEARKYLYATFSKLAFRTRRAKRRLASSR